MLSWQHRNRRGSRVLTGRDARLQERINVARPLASSSLHAFQGGSGKPATCRTICRFRTHALRWIRDQAQPEGQGHDRDRTMEQFQHSDLPFPDYLTMPGLKDPLSRVSQHECSRYVVWGLGTARVTPGHGWNPSRHRVRFVWISQSCRR